MYKQIPIAMSVVPESESALEFLATCAARLVTTWDTSSSSVPLDGPLTLYFQSGEITSAGGEWKGTLTVAGKLKLTRTSGSSSLVRFFLSFIFLFIYLFIIITVLYFFFNSFFIFNFFFFFFFNFCTPSSVAKHSPL